MSIYKGERHYECLLCDGAHLGKCDKSAYVFPDNLHLSVREQQLIILVCNGETNVAIGKKLGISTETVKRHLGNICDKTGMGSRSELSARFLPLIVELGHLEVIKERDRLAKERDHLLKENAFLRAELESYAKLVGALHSVGESILSATGSKTYA